MDCQQAKSQIPLYRASALDTADRRALECHLSGCQRCAELFAQGEALLRQAPLPCNEPEPAAVPALGAVQ